MANYTRTKQTFTSYRFTLPLPTNATEVDKAIAAAIEEWASEHSMSVSFVPDDAITIIAEDDVLVIGFTLREEK